MPKVTVYSTRYCPYCVRVKQLFERKGVAYEEIDLTENPDALIELKEKTDWQTVPQVFIGDRFVGGFDEISELEASGELDALLAST